MEKFDVSIILPLKSSTHPWFEDYFTKANIFGADIDSDILFEEERIKTFYCDQTSPESIAELWSKFDSVQFDFLLEDGLHTYDANICFFENIY
jgi:hypothetical protein